MVDYSFDRLAVRIRADRLQLPHQASFLTFLVEVGAEDFLDGWCFGREHLVDERSLDGVVEVLSQQLRDDVAEFHGEAVEGSGDRGRR